ncbi:hypothetical protein ACW7GZ_04785 [Luteimonas sp. A537]
MTAYHNLTTGTRDARNNFTNTFRNGAGEVVQVVEITGLGTSCENSNIEHYIDSCMFEPAPWRWACNQNLLTKCGIFE